MTLYKLKVPTRDGYKYKNVTRIRSLNRFEKIDGIVYQNDILHRDDFIKSGFIRNIARTIMACESRTGTRIVPIGVDKWEVIRDVPPVAKVKKERIKKEQPVLSMYERFRCKVCKENELSVATIHKPDGMCKACASSKAYKKRTATEK